MKELEWEREKERIALLGVTGSGARLDANSDGKGYRGQLPHMQDDVLAFFHALEKTLHLNNLPQYAASFESAGSTFCHLRLSLTGSTPGVCSLRARALRCT